ncbi:MAG TPA: MBL fold metallo-hydrolase [Terriglobales bacterium]|nr:MBL fold metallo-hydrolase [Terriglobales bacterium]
MRTLRRCRLALTLCLLAAAAAQRPAAQRYFTLHPVAPGVFAAIGVAGSGAGSNAGFVVGTRAVAVIDTFQDANAARQLLAAIRRQTALPVRYVINTHYHIDHVTGNQVFANAGAVILAQRNVPAWIHSENLKFFAPVPTPAQRAWVQGLRAPDVTYVHGIEIALGGRRLLVRALPGHTGGDSAVLVAGTGVVFTGDLFWCHSLPNLVDASTGPLLDSLAKLLAWPKARRATFVPGHGEVGHAADLAAFRGYVLALRTQVAAARARGLSGDVLAAALRPRFQAQYGGWGFFDHFIRLNLLQTDAELAGRKRIPQPAR